MGMRNRLVTRRDGGTHDWLTLDTYFDAPCAVDWVFGAFMLMRREEYMRMGGMDTALQIYYTDKGDLGFSILRKLNLFLIIEV